MSQSTLYPGAIPPPAGVVPNLQEPWSHLQYGYIASFVVAAVVATVFAVIRLYVKAFIVRRWAWADVAFFLCWVLFICDLSLCASNVNDGVYKHAWNITSEHFNKIQGRMNIIQVVYVVTNTLGKVTIMIQLADIFVPHKPHRRWNILLGLMAFTVGFYTIIFFIELFWCSPPSKIWNPELPGKCIDNSTIYIATSIVNVIDDFAILTLPVVWTFKLHISTKQKMKVAAIFAVGLFACICSLVRLIYSIRLLNTFDISWAVAPVGMWAMAEIAAGLVVAVMPYIPRLLKKMKNKDDSATKSTDSNSHGSSALSAAGEVNEHPLENPFEMSSSRRSNGHKESSSISIMEDQSIQLREDEEWLSGGDDSTRFKNQDYERKDGVNVITKSLGVEQYYVSRDFCARDRDDKPVTTGFPYTLR